MNPAARAVKFGLYRLDTRNADWQARDRRGCGILLQGFAIYAAITRSLVWPLKWPTGLPLYISIAADSTFSALAAQRDADVGVHQEDAGWSRSRLLRRPSRRRSQPDPRRSLPGYQIEVCARPFHNVGGDYLDVVTLPERRALLAIADVSGKGIAAALLSANVQALVRGLGASMPIRCS